jgi:hypothetical protein
MAIEEDEADQKSEIPLSPAGFRFEIAISHWKFNRGAARGQSGEKSRR